ncbi:MAG: DUF58 domain-containing protein [Ruminococcus sp.]|nr:DUF58 domain-containing protein [Ruminococcus sp.]
MKSLIGYLFCIAVAVVMAVMIDGTGGVLIAVILLTALIASLLLTKRLSRKLTVSIDCKHKLLAKGDIVEVLIKVEKHSRLPSPVIEIRLESGAQLAAKAESGIRFSMLPNRQAQTVKLEFKANYSGRSYIKVAAFEAVDFLGLSRSSIPVEEEAGFIGLRIMPNVPDTGTQMDVIRTATDNVGFDDSEDETSETAMGSTGTPGYEHRAYSPGDPLKKINWKLSSKRGIYMVRLDEKLSVTSQVFVLDLPEGVENYSCRRADVIIEGALAMLSMLAQQGLETDFYYYIEKWNMLSVKSLGDVYLLAEALSDMVPYSQTDRLPDEALRTGMNICFTVISSSDVKLAEELFSYKNVTVVADVSAGFTAGAGDIWTCSEDFEFKHLN